jgi:hypothetical protein
VSDFQRINRPRVDRILDILGLIAKSARAQRAPSAAIAAMLDPVAGFIAEFVVVHAPAPAPDADTLIEPRPPFPCADPDFAAALAAVRTMHRHRAPALADAVPADAADAVILHLQARLDELAAQQDRP